MRAGKRRQHCRRRVHRRGNGARAVEAVLRGEQKTPGHGERVERALEAAVQGTGLIVMGAAAKFSRKFRPTRLSDFTFSESAKHSPVVICSEQCCYG